ncbi:hypothetical protein MTP10_19050 [Nonomuraea sp. 3-1Str]|uniref:hypothetical protein n=1 Tax=Nonomuraea sp. 3-1Str TaxID=2929801 RepID=UPI00285FB270|nr:hypothetical protein [Nonomuraea sp. 3-1Str]MDR8410825.1 hypothetical protein [Nonomuraea sp. 3-1Str]
MKSRGSFVKGGADFVAQVVADGATRIINRHRAARAEPADDGWVTVVELGGEGEALPADKVDIRGTCRDLRQPTRFVRSDRKFR